MTITNDITRASRYFEQICNASPSENVRILYDIAYSEYTEAIVIYKQAIVIMPERASESHAYIFNNIMQLYPTTLGLDGVDEPIT